MSTYWTPLTSRAYVAPNFVVVWSKPLHYLRVKFNKWNAETQVWDEYYGYTCPPDSPEGAIWDEEATTVTQSLAAWPDGYYGLWSLVAHYHDGDNLYYYSESWSPGYGYYFTIGTIPVQPPPKASNPTPINGATGIDKNITTFTWSVT